MNHSHTRHRTPTRGASLPHLCRKAQGWCLLLLALLLSSCARMGRPDGGWYDETPPYVVGAVPKDGGTQVSARKIRILFNEFIKLENASEKVVVSPPQMEQPDIKSTRQAHRRGNKGLAEAQHHIHRRFQRRHFRQQRRQPSGQLHLQFLHRRAHRHASVSGYVLQSRQP